jgi:MerR family transcriptional regulator, thiopeptide resistance regulator
VGDGLMTIGQLARATGLTVRAIRHYEALGLLGPVARSAAGHRRYGEAEIRRLYQVRVMRAMGVPLAEVGRALGHDVALAQSLHDHLARLEGMVAAVNALAARLRSALAQAEAGGDVRGDALLHILEVMDRVDRYYTPEQRQALDERARALGPEGIAAAEQAWAELIAEMEAARQAGLPVEAPEVQALARRWRGLVRQFTGGDPGIAASLARMYRDQGADALSRGAMSEALMAYAMKAVGSLDMPDA